MNRSPIGFFSLPLRKTEARRKKNLRGLGVEFLDSAHIPPNLNINLTIYLVCLRFMQPIQQWAEAYLGTTKLMASRGMISAKEKEKKNTKLKPPRREMSCPGAGGTIRMYEPSLAGPKKRRNLQWCTDSPMVTDGWTPWQYTVRTNTGG